MLNNVFRVVVDPLYPPPDFNMAKKNHMAEILPINKLELIFDERLTGPLLRKLFKDEPKLNLRISDDEGEGQEEGDEGSESADDGFDSNAASGNEVFVESCSGGSPRSM
jgi:hypothetical protein